MSDTKQIRIFMTGVGGQGTLTATTLLAKTVLSQGLPVTSGEIHGMAQRGGVVESTVLIGCKSPKIGHGEADILIGFEPMETMRALPYLKCDGLVLSSTEFMPPLSVAMGKQECPTIDDIKKAVAGCTNKISFMPSQTIGLKAGAVQAGNIAMLAALCASGELPFGPEALEATIKANLPEKIQAVNLKALELGVAALNA
ncbi:Indolepyruvate ferredoxin oxidoreductase [Pseudodesulfovibrio profundus]|uniref:Indolepyruvate ferredoxin oxidoreductase n=1 Tax=Pseudodesulfovibrio profundus TaxID=57320 RepID=A0A2C8FB98_9BACT|nr:indolepyruvate oxidoreductase subunit beta [Pseudodesulfovibrio profundus]MBC15532.1 indolepyruvate ferredoxin oxidoreductase [Desulfovibrio sp.]SOB59916.1 Indolepyruvate ferredoxin oxidoreductase [Pseudodesulfovibrio profundus]|tara:strand:+ start:284 stop:880 length:597 start_codon:yes stop_codon:yes gene_type:complete